MKWYKCLGYIGHIGAGRREEILVYVKAKDIVDALKVYNNVPKIQVARRGMRMPNIIVAEESDIRMIEEKEKRQNRRFWFYFQI